ncbi:MAG: hypothetical protein ACK55I_00765, partial [bacterium]
PKRVDRRLRDVPRRRHVVGGHDIHDPPVDEHLEQRVGEAPRPRQEEQRVRVAVMPLEEHAVVDLGLLVVHQPVALGEGVKGGARVVDDREHLEPVRLRELRDEAERVELVFD